MNTLWYSPPVAVVAYTLVVVALYGLGDVLSEKGAASVDKHLPYTGGELPTRSRDAYRYHAFFRLALLFVILHVAALVVSTLPTGGGFHRAALIYLAGVAVSVVVLMGREE
jgi:NADH:ubiquinone oxidoreductase subunit 3 (subunit A)